MSRARACLRALWALVGLLSLGLLGAGALLGQAGADPVSEPMPRVFRSEAAERALITQQRGPWEHRWGASAEGPWHPAPATGAPPGRGGEQFLWMRTRLTGPKMPEPTLFLMGVDQVFEAYVDGVIIYRFGHFTGPDALRFPGYRIHLIPLPQDYAGRTLVLRVYSARFRIGLVGFPRIGPRGALLVDLFRGDLPRLSVGVVLAVMGIGVLILFFFYRENKAHGQFGGFALMLGLYLVTQTGTRALLFDAPILWAYVELCALYLTVPLLIGFIEAVFGQGSYGLTERLRKFHLLYVAGAAVLVATGLVPLPATLPPFQLLLLVDMVYLITEAVRQARRGGLDGLLFSAGIMSGSAVCLFDLLCAVGILPRYRMSYVHYGCALFVACLGLILARRFVAVHRRAGDYSTVLQLSLASARSLEPGQHARVALDELVRLLHAKRALLFLVKEAPQPEPETLSGEHVPRPPSFPPREPGDILLELRAGRDESGATLTDWEGVATQIVEEIKVKRRPIITRARAVLTDPGTGRSRQLSVMAAPLLMREELLGVIYLEAEATRRTFQEDDLEILLGLGNQVAIALWTARAVQHELESALKQRRLEEQSALLDAAVRMAAGDLESPIAVRNSSELTHLARALDDMRQDLQAKIQILEQHNREIGSLNDELRRQIEARSTRLLEAMLGTGGAAIPGKLQLQPGQLLGDVYRVVRALGAGAMGTVYEVERATDHRRFAAKILAATSDRSLTVRFAREAQILARLSHPNLIGIVDVDMTGQGVLYIVMELVDGSTLKQQRDRFGDLPWALEVLRQMAAALEVVHREGIVHREPPAPSLRAA